MPLSNHPSIWQEAPTLPEPQHPGLRADLAARPAPGCPTGGRRALHGGEAIYGLRLRPVRLQRDPCPRHLAWISQRRRVGPAEIRQNRSHMLNWRWERHARTRCACAIWEQRPTMPTSLRESGVFVNETALFYHQLYSLCFCLCCSGDHALYTKDRSTILRVLEFIHVLYRLRVASAALK